MEDRPQAGPKQASEAAVRIIAELCDTCAFMSLRDRRQAANIVDSEIRPLIEALRKLRNEAKAILAVSDPSICGVTNIRCLESRITEADAVISRARGV